MLKGWRKFKGGLNTTEDTTGTHSIYTKACNNTQEVRVLREFGSGGRAEMMAIGDRSML